MAPRIKYDLDIFRALVVIGKNKVEIMDEMSIEKHPTFKNLMLKLMVTDKKYYETKESKKKAVEVVPKVAIGKRNTLTLSAKILEGNGFGAKDTFNIKFTKKKIILALVE